MVNAFAMLLVLTAVLAWFNDRFVKIPTTVGVTLAGALASITLLVLDAFGLAGSVRGIAEQLLTTLDFTDFMLNGILSILLFAGAMSLDARQLLAQRASILTLASVGTLLSTALLGLAAWGIFAAVGISVPLIWALLFGALISPTDPVAVLDLLKRARVPKRLETLIAGESLFNDGFGVVVFVALAGVAGIGSAAGQGELDAVSVAVVFAREAFGGMAYGAAIGYVGYLMCRGMTSHVVEVLITLAMVLGGYLGAVSLHLSGPLAMVIAGLVISARQHHAFFPETSEHVGIFWETLDQVLNVLLFAFIGFDVLLTETTGPQVMAAVCLVPLALLARFVSVSIPMRLLRGRQGHGPWTIRLLTWGGLRGGIAISLALGLPPVEYRQPILAATYAIVLFSIAVQGLTVMPMVRRAAIGEARQPD